MSTRNDILNELRGWDSPLADMSRAMPYHIPKDYFNSLPDNVDKAIEHNIIPVIWSKKMPFYIPEKYFTNLPGDILDAIHNGQQTVVMPLNNPLSVPEGYFDNLAGNILNSIKQEEPKTAKKIPLGANVWKNVRWAAAAVLLLGIGLGSYNIFIGNPAKNPSLQQELATLSENTISEYVQQNIDDFDMELIENTVASNVSTESLNPNMLTDEEIKLYLDENGWETEIN